MLLERKTLYDTRAHSRNIPQHRKIHLCTTRETEEKELCIIGGEPGQQVFYTAIKKKEKKEKTEKERRKGGNLQPSKTSGKDNTELCIIFLILYLR